MPRTRSALSSGGAARAAKAPTPTPTLSTRREDDIVYEGDEFAFEAIIGHRRATRQEHLDLFETAAHHHGDFDGSERGMMFKVKWAGYRQTTWEPAHNFDDPAVVQDYMMRRERKAIMGAQEILVTKKQGPSTLQSARIQGAIPAKALERVPRLRSDLASNVSTDILQRPQASISARMQPRGIVKRSSKSQNRHTELLARVTALEYELQQREAEQADAVAQAHEAGRLAAINALDAVLLELQDTTHKNRNPTNSGDHHTEGDIAQSIASQRQILAHRELRRQMDAIRKHHDQLGRDECNRLKLRIAAQGRELFELSKAQKVLSRTNSTLAREKRALTSQRDANADGTEFIVRQLETLTQERDALQAERDELLEEVTSLRDNDSAARRLTEIDQMCATAIDSAVQTRRDNLRLIEQLEKLQKAATTWAPSTDT